ncbi:hypothetical protein [Bacillus toyonensis]|nr:hypothetical protein [Bacillus toyonensis]
MTEDILLQPLSDLDFLRIIHQFQWITTNQLAITGAAYTGEYTI